MKTVNEELAKVFSEQLQILEKIYGLANVVIAAPVSWRELGELENLKQVRMEFCTKEHLVFRANFQGKVIEVQHAC